MRSSIFDFELRAEKMLDYDFDYDNEGMPYVRISEQDLGKRRFLMRVLCAFRTATFSIERECSCGEILR